MSTADRSAPSRRVTRRTMLGATGTVLTGMALGSAAHHVAVAQESSPMAEAVATPEGMAFSPEEQLAFEAIIDAGLAVTASPGALVGVWYPGRGDWIHATGLGDVTTAAPITVDDHVRIASITKTFVATVILQLVDEGALSLDDSLESHIPGVANGAEITLRQVLGMSAGIYDFINDPVISEESEADPLLPFTPEDALAIIQAGARDFAPGERTQYSNSNYILLGMIAEDVTGQQIDRTIQDRILAPLGMTGTSFPTTPAMPAPFAHGYDAGEPGTELRDVTRSNPGIPWASGAMISTLADLRVWAQELATGSLLAPETQAERVRFGLLAEGRVSLSYGLGILDINGLVGHNGGIRGYNSWVVHEPDSGASIVAVTNRGGNEGGFADPIFLGLASYLFPEKFAAFLNPPPALEASPVA